ncbi:MAG TPA: VWA domain-containing protein [Intrasporangiaceae bacterium]|nr:VWA domain-containing protein [Intrasporangiaceae bacterium]
MIASGAMLAALAVPVHAQTGSLDSGSLDLVPTQSVEGGSGSLGSVGRSGGDPEKVADFTKPVTANELDMDPKPGTIMTNDVPVSLTDFDAAGIQRITVPAEFPEVVAGDYLHIGATTSFPTGAYGKVVEVANSAAGRVISITSAPIADGFDKYFVDAEFTYDETTIPLTGDYVAPPSSQFRPAQGTSGAFSVDLWKSPVPNGGSISLSCSRSIGVSDVLRAELKQFSISPSVRGDLTKLERMDITVKSDIRFLNTIKLARSYGCSVTGVLPSVPILWGTLRLAPGITGGIDFTNTSDLTWGFEYHETVNAFVDPRALRAGASITANGVTAARESRVTTAPDSVIAKIHPLVKISTYGEVGSVTLDIGIDLSANKKPPNCLAFTAAVGVGLTAGVNAKLGMFGFSKEFSGSASTPAYEFSRMCGPTRPGPSTPAPSTTVTGTSSGGGSAGTSTRKDTMFVIDTTGSMDYLISEARARAADLATKLLRSDPNSRVGLVEYRDHGDDFVARTVVPLTKNYATFQDGLNRLATGGGGDTPEAVYSGIVEALRAPWDPAAMRSIIVIGDAPAHDPESVTGYTAAQVARMMKGYGALTTFSPASERIPNADRSQEPGQTVQLAMPRPVLLPVADIAEPAERPSVSLYGITASHWLNEQLTPLAEETQGTVVDVNESDSVGDAIDKALTDIETRPVAVISSPGVVTVGTSFAVDCSASTAGAGLASQKVSLDGGTPVDCAAGGAQLVARTAGAHLLTLTVVDAKGREAVATVTVTAEAGTGGGGSLDTGSLDTGSLTSVSSMLASVGN